MNFEIRQEEKIQNKYEIAESCQRYKARQIDAHKQKIVFTDTFDITFF